MKSFIQSNLAITKSAWIAPIVATLCLTLSYTRVYAGLARPFTPGDIVVERFGDGSTPISSAGTPIFFDEMTTSGTLVQSIEIITNGPIAMVEAASSTSAGGMTLATNGQYVVFPGYNTNAGVAAVSGTASSAVPRGIGQLDAYGNYTLPCINTTAFSASNERGACSDGNGNYWASGTSGNTSGGIWYFGTNIASAAQIFNTASANANLRCCAFLNGNLSYSTASSTGPSYGIWSFPGEQTTAATASQVLTLTSTYGTYNFSGDPFATASTNIIYFSDDGDESATMRGIHKWVYNGTSWSQAYLLISNTPCYGLLVNWGTSPVTIYATTGEGTVTNSVIELQDTGINSVAVTNATCGTNEIYRGLSWVPTNTTLTAQAPTINGIFPASATVASATSPVITLFGTLGNPAGTVFWYETNNAETNLVAGQTGATLSFPDASPGESGGYFAVISNSVGSVTSAISSLTITPNPVITGISPSGTNFVTADSTVTFTLSGTVGIPAASNFWYHISNSMTNLFAFTTNVSLTLSNVVSGNDGGYFAVLTNLYGTSTSAVVTLIVTNDPQIQAEPNAAVGLLDGQAQFSVTAFGTSPLYYQWWYALPDGQLAAPIADGPSVLADGSGFTGAQSSVLSFTNVQPDDLTNVVVVVTNIYGAVTSTPAMLVQVNTTLSPLVYWDFYGSIFTNTAVNPNCVSEPVPYIGVGTAQAVGTLNLPGTSPFVATTTYDSTAGLPSPLGGNLPQPGFSWGVGEGALPTTDGISTNFYNSNKLSGVQFTVSTVGAKNIKFGFDARATQTSSEYERVQYTTNGTTWIDYPAAQSFDGISGSGFTGWESYPAEDAQNNSVAYDYYGPGPLSTYYDFTGFPGVANNPNFGIRIAVEYESTATYGVEATNDYVGVGEQYGFGGGDGTLTYDLVAVYGDAITNNNVPPVISGFYTNSILVTNETTEDTVPITNTFSVLSGDTTADKFTYAAYALNPSEVQPSFAFSSNADGNCTLVITPGSINPNVAATPILVTVTDTNGDSAAGWFLLTVTTEYPAPTVSGLVETNTLVNTPASEQFAVSSPVDNVANFTYSANSENNTVAPSANVSFSTATPANPIVAITPANNELGVAAITVNVDDQDSTDPKTTSVTVPVMVTPNTNVVAIDYFNYDNSGALDSAAVDGGFWQHLSGIDGQMQVAASPTGGSVYVNTTGNSENLQTPLFGAPYLTSSTTVTNLYYSFVVNMNPGNMPLVNGTYFAGFNDGTLTTANVDDLLVAATNGAAFGNYRLGISDDVGATSTTTDTSMFSQDLVPGNNYVIVTCLNLQTGTSTLWINPSDQSSPSVTAVPDTATVPYNIGDFELRESGGSAGGIYVSYLKVGTTFDSVFPSLHVQAVGSKVIVNWSDPTLGIQSATNLLGPFTDVPSATPPYTNNVDSDAIFYRFGH